MATAPGDHEHVPDADGATQALDEQRAGEHPVHGVGCRRAEGEADGVRVVRIVEQHRR
jgi:hypothetical protein